LRTFDNKNGDKIVRAIYRSRDGIGLRELQRETGLAFKTLVGWLKVLRNTDKVKRYPTIPICLTESAKKDFERYGKCTLIVDRRKRQRHIRNPNQRFIRGKEYAIIKKEYMKKKERAICLILLNAANNPVGVIRYRKLDTKFTSYGFDTLTLSIPPILQVFSYNNERQEETLVIDKQSFREFIIHLNQLLELLLNRMQVVWTYKRKPKDDEVKWFEFYHDKELKNKKFTDFHNLRNHRYRNKNANQKYKLKITHFDRLIRKTWYDIKKRYSHLSKESEPYIYREIYNLMTDRVYPKFLQHLCR
jgi:hypothetical protein